MLEFALVAPLLFVIIFLVIAVSFIYAARIAEHKSAYDVARLIAKTHQDTSGYGGSDTGAAESLADSNYNHSWVLRTFVLPASCPAGTPGVSGNGNLFLDHGPGDAKIKVDASTQAVEVRLCYTLNNIPGWQFLAGFYGAESGLLQERGMAARVVDSY